MDNFIGPLKAAYCLHMLHLKPMSMLCIYAWNLVKHKFELNPKSNLDLKKKIPNAIYQIESQIKWGKTKIPFPAESEIDEFSESNNGRFSGLSLISSPRLFSLLIKILTQKKNTNAKVVLKFSILIYNDFAEAKRFESEKWKRESLTHRKHQVETENIKKYISHNGMIS